MVYLDLDEIPAAIKKSSLLSESRFAPLSFLQSDHFGKPEYPLAESVRSCVLAETGQVVRGPIRVLTQLRTWGHYFSPLNVFYCFDETGQEIEFIVAEVSNTPWRERYCYVLWEGNRQDNIGGLSFRNRKQFHVSPFMDMDSEYLWRLTGPQQRLELGLVTSRQGVPFFDASMTLSRHPLCDTQLLRVLFRYPFMTLRICGAIYYQALKLWMKKCPFYPHTKKNESRSTHSAS